MMAEDEADDEAADEGNVRLLRTRTMMLDAIIDSNIDSHMSAHMDQHMDSLWCAVQPNMDSYIVADTFKPTTANTFHLGYCWLHN